MEKQLSTTEEKYIKAIYHLINEGSDNEGSVGTNQLAEAMNTSAASVSDMIKRLHHKDYVNYLKYKGVSLTKIGFLIAVKIIRKHRLWKVFLVDKLGFKWDEVHVIAEQLEHINSAKLTDKLDSFLGFPRLDPHGDAIPDENGTISKTTSKTLLANVQTETSGIVVAVNDENKSLLTYLDKINIHLGSTIKVIEKIEFDDSLEILINNSDKKLISKEIAKNIYIKH